MRGNRKVSVTNIKPSVEEVYKMLQMRMSSVMNAGNMKVIAFTSVVPCEEKSAYVYNIAKSMVLEGKKVLVIDCNIDYTKIHHSFGIEMETIQSAEGEVQNGSRQMIRKVPEMPRLNFVPGGLELQGSGGILDMEKISALIEKVKDEYDIILIDSPPAGIVTEGVKLSVIADGTVLVLLSGKTPKASAKRVKKMLDAVNVTVLGVILEQ